MVGLFSPPPAADNLERDAFKQSAFQQLKAITVPLLDASRSPVSSGSTRILLALLEKLQTVLGDIPDHAFSPALANYAFFPLTSLLQPRPDGANRGDQVLETLMQTLDMLIGKWRCAGMDERVRRELWTMTILTLGGPLDAKDGGKGKAVDRTEEAKLAMVLVLGTLMKPQADPLWPEETAFDAGQAAREAQDLAGPSLSIIFHTLTTLLALALESTSLVQLQLASISALSTLTVTYLAPTSTDKPSSLLATALPGMASTLCRIALSKPPSSSTQFETTSRKQNSAVVVDSLDLLSQLVYLSVSDRVTNGLRQRTPIPTLRLEELSMQDSQPESPNDEDAQAKISSGEPAATKGPTVPTPAWLQFTVSSITSLVAKLSPLASHFSPQVRLGLVSLLDQIVKKCHVNFGALLEGPLEGLLVLSRDEWPIVSDPARRALHAVLEDANTPPRPSGFLPILLLGQIVQRRLAGLSQVLRKRDEDAIRRSACIVQAGLDLSSDGASQKTLIGDVSRYGWSILGSIELDRRADSATRGNGGMSLAWIAGQPNPADTSSTTFPTIRLRNIHDVTTTKALENLWKALGASAAKAEQDHTLVDYFLGVALGPRRRDSTAASALWILDGILNGFTGLEIDKRRKKLLRGVAKTVIALIEDLEAEEDASTATAQEARDEPEVSEATTHVLELPAIEHTKGTVSLPSLDNYKPVVARSSSASDRASHRFLLLELAMRILATAATLLKASYQPLLLSSLYHVLAYSSSTAPPSLRVHAQTALAIIAESTASTSPQELVLANVDYVVNSVSQRMSVTRLDPSAPLVLVEMIRLVGHRIVSIVQDLVDDVFEALDDYHGYEEITVGLWAVFDALLKVMEADLPVPIERTKQVPHLDSHYDVFKQWFVTRQAQAQEPDLPEVNPRKPFESGYKNDKAGEEGTAEFPDSQVAPPPPTRPQIVTAQILSKALYFLSHPSSFLRARVLSLFASAVPLLARPSLGSNSPEARTADLLPIVHRAWPFILNRFTDPDLSVVLEAARLIESLAVHVGDFMSRRILDDVWPHLRTLLSKQQIEDSSSAIAGSTRYSTSHRLYSSNLKTLARIARDVPLKENVVWEQAVGLRRFLSVRVDRELQQLALEVYKGLGKVNSDAVWLVLVGTVSKYPGVPVFLEMPGVDFGDNISSLLENL
ncbi:Tti1p [Sporobolomyces koalae]|uniref:Tti1p n=1 Tax=Sporobolomyces koalae TaxID=500713 RepID=UPI003176327B